MIIRREKRTTKVYARFRYKQAHMVFPILFIFALYLFKFYASGGKMCVEGKQGKGRRVKWQYTYFILLD